MVGNHVRLIGCRQKQIRFWVFVEFDNFSKCYLTLFERRIDCLTSTIIAFKGTRKVTIP
jgi:hypothetical protein